MKTLKELLNLVASKLKTEEVKVPLAPASFGKEELDKEVKTLSLEDMLFQVNLKKGQTKEAAIQEINGLIKGVNFIVVLVTDYSTGEKVIVKLVDIESMFQEKQAFEMELFKSRLAEKTEFERLGDARIMEQCLEIIDGNVVDYDTLIAYKTKLKVLMSKNNK